MEPTNKKEIALEDLLSPKTVANILGVQVQTLNKWRCLSHGPRYIKLSYRRIAYRRADVLEWLESRSFSSTSQATTSGISK